MVSLGQAIEDDPRTPFERARLTVLRKYCDEKEIPYSGNITKNKILLLISANTDIDVGHIMPVVKATKAAINGSKDPALDGIRKQYEEKVGKKPTHNMKIETMLKAIKKADNILTA